MIYPQNHSDCGLIAVILSPTCTPTPRQSHPRSTCTWVWRKAREPIVWWTDYEVQTLLEDNHCCTSSPPFLFLLLPPQRAPFCAPSHERSISLDFVLISFFLCSIFAFSCNHPGPLQNITGRIDPGASPR